LDYYLKLDFDTDKPIELLRANLGTVTAWRNSEWVPSVRTVGEMEGLGGYAPFRPIPTADRKKWQKRFS
jgi:hypothetical protein